MVQERLSCLSCFGVAGGEAGAFVGLEWFAVDVLVARFRGDTSCIAVSGSGNSLGWFRVATMFAII